MTEHDCNLIEEMDPKGEFGWRAVAEKAVKRIEEKDQLIERLLERNEFLIAANERLDAARIQAIKERNAAQSTITYVHPDALVFMDDIPEGRYEVAPDTEDLDDYEYLQGLYE